MKSYLAGAAIATLAVGAQAAPLWGTAEDGASVSEVAKLYPEGSSVTPTDKERFPDGAAPGYRIAALDVVGKPFKVTFYFLNDKLKRVLLVHDADVAPGICDITAKSVHEALATKYGIPLKSERSGKDGVIERDASWTSGPTRISLLMYAFPKPVQSCMITVAYNSRAELSKNL